MNPLDSNDPLKKFFKENDFNASRIPQNELSNILKKTESKSWLESIQFKWFAPALVTAVIFMGVFKSDMVQKNYSANESDIFMEDVSDDIDDYDSYGDDFIILSQDVDADSAI